MLSLKKDKKVLTTLISHIQCLFENQNDDINVNDYGDDDYNDNQDNDGILAILLLMLYFILSTIAHFTLYTF
jgi:hypothetical protein